MGDTNRTARLPRRVDADGTTFALSLELAGALRRAAPARHAHWHALSVDAALLCRTLSS